MSDTISGSRGLVIEEPLIFEQNTPGQCGVDLPEPAPVIDRLGGLERKGEIGLPGLSEPTVVRHYTRLSQKNFGIDSVFYPLGSCTMKHNPRLNEKMARLPGLADIHPFQPMSTVQGALELIDLAAHWLKTLTGMPAIAMSSGGRRAWRVLRPDGHPRRRSKTVATSGRASWSPNRPMAPTRRAPRRAASPSTPFRPTSAAGSISRR